MNYSTTTKTMKVSYMYKVLFFSITIWIDIVGAQASECSWEEITPSGTIPSKRHGHTAIYYDETMVVFGGYDSSTVFNDVFKLNLKTNTWTKPATSGTIPSPRRYAEAIYYNDSMVVFGGYNGNSEFNNVFKLNLTTNAWVEVTPSGTLPSKRRHHAAIYYNDNMVVFGGYNSSHPRLNDVFKLNLITNTWVEVTPSGAKPSGRVEATAIYYNDNMVVFGGQGSGSTWFNDVFKLNLKTNIWTKPTASGTIPSGRLGLTSIVYGDFMVLFGGHADSDYYNDVYTLDLTMYKFTNLSTSGTAPSKVGYLASVFYNDSMTIFGGHDSSLSSNNEVWSLDLLKLKEWCSIPTSGSATITSDCILNSQIVVTGSLNITGVPDAQGNLPKIIGGGSNRLFKVESGGELVVKYLNLTGGSVIGTTPCSWNDGVNPDNSACGGGSIYVKNGALKLYNCVLMNSAADNGGSIYQQHGNVTIVNCTISFNSAHYGAGLFAAYGTLHIVNSTISENTASQAGGGLDIRYQTAIIRNSNINKNIAQLYDGGGIRLYSNIPANPTLLTLEDSIIQNNICNAADETSYGGGGMQIQLFVGVAIRRTIFDSNIAANNNGDDLFVFSGGSPFILLSNVHIAEDNNVKDDGSNATWKTCADRPCTVFPFTGTCTNRTGNLGVLCDYGEEAICYPDTFKKKVTENVLPPSSKYCQACEDGEYTTAQNLPVCSTCNIPPKGNATVTEDCIQRTQIVVTGVLNVTGVPDEDGNLPAIMGGGSNRLFRVEGGGELVVTKLNITNGHASKSGGAIYVTGPASALFATDMHFINNYAQDAGGAISVENAFARLRNCYLRENKSPFGGGIFARDPYWESEYSGVTHAVELIDSIVESNTGTDRGGGLVGIHSGKYILNRTIVNNNHAGGSGGGGLFIESSSSMHAYNCFFEHNEAHIGAGFIVDACCGNSIVHLENTSVRWNKAINKGGGFYLTTSALYTGTTTLIMDRCIITDNEGLGSTMFFGSAGQNVLLISINNGYAEFYNNSFVGDIVMLPNNCSTAPTQCVDNGYNNPICVDKPNPNEGVLCYTGCQPGKYGANVSACHDCPRGKYGTEAAKTTELEACFPCAAGTYNNETGKTACHTHCPAGRFGNVTGGRSIVEGCPKQCNRGRYGNLLGKTNLQEACPSQCSAGTYGTLGATAESDCIICEAGTYSSAGAGNCTVCPSGTYLEAGAAAENHDSVADCVVCSAGKYLVTNGKAENHDSVNDCTDCPAGRYLEDRATNASKHDSVGDCTNCSAGKSSEALGLAVECGCLSCKPGEHAPVSGQKSCTACPAGKYQDGVGAELCLGCATATETGFTSCNTATVVDAPSRPIITHESQHRLRLSWSHADALFEVQWSEQDTFSDANSNTTNATEMFINTKTPLSLAVVYVRVKVVGGPWSLVSLPWTVASDCDIVNQYLNTSLTLVKWTCETCPVGASCAGNEVTWSEVKALFGWWRHTVGTAPSNFTRCLFPPACMGAPNPEFQGQFENASGYDVSMVDSPEQCALSSGYAQQCEGDGAPRCRLCATCAYGYRRRIMDGMARCDACPKQTENRLKIAGGALLGLGLLAFLVRINLGSEGKRTTAEMYQIIILDYLQTSSLVVTMDVPWPDLLQFIFSVQGVVSTIGEHLLSPDCELTDVRPADVMYQKQLGYVLLPWAASFGSWVFWRIVCLWQRRGWTSGEPSYQDKFVATVVFLLFLLYPTMCNASFALLSSKEVNGQFFLHADLQEPFMSGRHLLFVLLLSVPQLAFVFGLPIVGYLILRKHHRAKRLQEPRVQFRYGMLYSGYQYKCWWWDMVVAYRKAAISFVTNYVPSSVEIHVLLFVLTLSLFLNTQWRPYTDEEASDKKQRQSLHNMGAYSMLLVYVTAWSGFYFKDSPYCEKDTWSCMTLMVMIALLNSCFFVYCVVMLGYAYLGKRMPDVALHWKRVTKRCKRRQPNIVLEEDKTFTNPMYRSGRTSSYQSRMASRADVEMAPVFKALGMSGKENKRWKERYEMKDAEVRRLKAEQKRLKAKNDAEGRRLKAEQEDEIKRLKATIESVTQTI